MDVRGCAIRERFMSNAVRQGVYAPLRHRVAESPLFSVLLPSHIMWSGMVLLAAYSVGVPLGVSVDSIAAGAGAATLGRDDGLNRHPHSHFRRVGMGTPVWMPCIDPD